MKATPLNFFFRLCLLFFAVSFFSKCTNETPKEKKEIISKPILTTPTFNSDSAFEFTAAQVAFGPRIMNSKNHELCAAYLENKLKEFADTVIVQRSSIRAWDGNILKISNLIGSFDVDNQNRVILCSHWDSRPWADQDDTRKKEAIDGANDGAAGVGVLLEIARQLKSNKPNIGVDIILFDAEDYGQPEDSGLPNAENSWCLGSQYWSANMHKPGYYARYGILLDMIGAKDATFTQEGVSVQLARNIVEKVWNTGKRLGFSSYFSYAKTHPITDDHYYINTIANIPCIDIIQHDPSTDSKFYVHWHTHKDQLEFIDKKSLHAVGQTLLEVVFKEN